jgi:hypothetical protein
MRGEDTATLVRLELALRAVGNALGRADLDRLLTAEPELAAALEAVARLEPGVLDRDARIAIDAARAALLRCRRLGAALMEFTRISLDPSGQSGYSRAAMLPRADRASTAPAVVVGPTLEARG